MKWKVPSPPLRAHSSVWEQERAQKALCSHSWAVHCLALCTVTPCCSSATRKGHPAQQSQGKGGKVSIIPVCHSHLTEVPMCQHGHNPAWAPMGDSSAKSQGVTGKALGFSTPFLLNWGYSKENCLFKGGKAAECSTMHPAPDHGSRGPSFPNHFFSFRARTLIPKEFLHRPWGDKVAMSLFLLCGHGFLQNLLTWRSDLELGGLIPGS